MGEIESKIVDTRITDHWGVQWSPMEIVRDFLQNFYDDNKIDDIKINISKNTVTVSAPNEFDYEELLYLGSHKGKDKVGQYGEGFKAATLNIMRNHNSNVEIIVGGKKLKFFFDNKVIGGKEKKIVMCEIVSVKRIQGTQLALSNCPSEIVKEFEFGLNYFYYKDNPLFGDCLTSTYEDDIVIYKSTLKEGYVFYKKLLRAKLDVPLVFVCNREYKAIEDKIKHDRDRKAFNDDLLNKYLKLVCKPIHPKDAIVIFLKPWWQKGHKVLSGLASTCRWPLDVDFPENYYAKSGTYSEIDVMLKIQALEKEYRDKKYFECPIYMSRFGMKSALSEMKKREKELLDKHKKIHARRPNELENSAIRILEKCVKVHYPWLADRYRSSTYTIGNSDEILGELKEGRGYHSKDVYFSQKVFSMEFGDALAILLHEWGHIYGHDGSRSFTDALTDFMATVIKERKELDSVEKEWKAISAKITKNSNKDKPSVYDHIERLSSSQKNELLKSLPEDELFSLLDKKKFI